MGDLFFNAWFMGGSSPKEGGVAGSKMHLARVLPGRWRRVSLERLGSVAPDPKAGEVYPPGHQG